MEKRIYMDYAAATPVDERVRAAMEPFYSDVYANPSSLHTEGRYAKKALEDARDSVANVLNCKAREIVFTSGATESNNMAILGAHPGHTVTVATEHPSVLEPVRTREHTLVPVERDGIINLNKFERELRKSTRLVTIAYANSEVGTVQPIRDLADIVHKQCPQALFHTDASQAAGYLDLDVTKLGVHLMTINGGKIYGPKGSGVLYIQSGVSIRPITHGGKQEYGVRPGTVNVAGAIGIATALDIAEAGRSEEVVRLVELRDYFFKQLVQLVDGATINGHQAKRLPNNVNISLRGIDGEVMMLMLDEHGIACSTGSACSTSSSDSSYVVRALGGKPSEALRFTLGRWTTREDIDTVLQKIRQVVVHL